MWLAGQDYRAADATRTAHLELVRADVAQRARPRTLTTLTPVRRSQDGNRQQTTIAGNLVEEPELRFTNTGTPVTNLRVAVTQRIQQDGGGATATHPVQRQRWRGQAEHLADSLTKGDRAMVTGRLRQRTWETPKARSGQSPRSRPTRSGPASSSPPPKSNAAPATAAKAASGRPNEAATSTTNPLLTSPPFRRPRPWLGALTFERLRPWPLDTRSSRRLDANAGPTASNSGACRYGCVSQDGGAAIPRSSPNPRPSDSDGDGCSASAWMAPDGSSLLTLDGALRPDGSRRIRKDRLDDHRDDRRSRQNVGCSPWWGVDAKLTASRCRPVAAGWVGHGLGDLTPRPGDRLLAFGMRRRCRSGRAAPSPGWVSRRAGLMLVDAPHHAALHPQGVVEQLALAVGGVLDQLGERPLPTGRLTRAEQVEPHATGHLQVRRRSFWLRT